MNKKRNGTKLPGIILYAVCVFAANIFIRLFFRFRKPKSSSLPAGPCVVLANHTSKFDYLFLASAVWPMRVNFVVSVFYTQKKILGAFLRYIGCIPKYQFQSDPAAIKSMVEVIRKGGNVAIYPQGQIPYEGRIGKMPPGLGKLIKLLSCSVAVMKTDGGYFTAPKWAKKARFGKPDFRLENVLTKEQVQSLDAGEIDEIVSGELAFDDYKWIEGSKRNFRGRKLAESMDHVLYMCPKCGHEFTLRTHNNTVYCESCGVNSTVGRNGCFSTSDFEVRNPGEWIDFQRRKTKETAASAGFSFSGSAELKMMDKSSLGYYGHTDGTLTLTENGLEFISEDGRTKKLFEVHKLDLIACDIGKNFEIGDQGVVHVFTPQDSRSVVKWLDAADGIFSTHSGSREK